MRVLRSSLFVAATAIIAAACGDKVTVTQPPLRIESVIIAPSTATLSIGQAVTFTAAVNADPGVTATVTWSANAPGGVFTATAATPGTAVCATASASNAGSVQGCATVIVNPATPIVPAVLQIASITVAGNLNNPVPVPPAAVAGQINVSVNLNPGTEKVDSVVVTVNGKSAATQAFTDAQAAALRAAEGSADQALQSTLVFSINTAAYSATTGAVTWLNGPAAIGVTAYGHQGAAAANPTSSQGVNLLFGNVDAWVVAQSLSLTKVANDAAGFSHQTGAVAVTAIPVLYSGGTIGTATVNYGTVGCDASGIGQRNLALTAPAAGTFAWTASFPLTSVTTTTNNSTNRASVNSYEFSPAACPGANSVGGEGAAVAAAQYTNTNSAPTGFALGSGAPVARLDNHAPTGMTLALNAGTRTNSWFNDAVLLNTSNTTSASNGIVNAAADFGVGGIVYNSFVGGTAATTTAALAESATNTTYTLTESASDALGNTSTIGAAQTITFGVDRTAPVLAIIGGSAANARNAVFPVGNYAFSATDNTTSAGAAPSGFFNLGGTPLTVSQQYRNAAHTWFWCPTTVAYQASTTACATWATNTTNYAGNLNISEVNASAVDAYYTISSTVADQAGNVSASIAQVELDDATAPAIGGLSYNPFFVAGAPATFSSTTIDNLDIQLERLNLVYGAVQPGAAGGLAATFADGGAGWAGATSAVGGSTFWYPDQAVNSYNNATLVTTHSMAFTTTPLEMIQTRATADGTGSAVNAAGIMNTANGIVLNQANTATSSGSPIIPGSLPAFAAVTNTGAAGFGPVKWNICSQVASTACPAAYATPVAFPALTVSRAGTAPNPASVTINAIATGATGVFNNPWSQVQFWAYDPTAGATEGWRLIGTVTNSAAVTDGGLAEPAGRNWQFSFTWVPTKVTAPDNATYRIVAVGIGGTNLPAAQQGMAVATPLWASSVVIVP